MIFNVSIRGLTHQSPEVGAHRATADSNTGNSKCAPRFSSEHDILYSKAINNMGENGAHL